MNKEIRSELCPGWEDIDRLIIEPYDLEDLGNRYGISRWQEEMSKVHGAGDDGGRFSSEEVHNAALAFFKADIEENIFMYRAKLIRNKRARKLMDLRRAIAEFEGIGVEDENGDPVLPGPFAERRETRSSKIKKLKQVVYAAETIANGGSRNGVPFWPAGLGDGFDIFAKDIADFIEKNESVGIEMVNRVCRDVTFAKEMCDDGEMPRCVRFLAEIVVEVKTVNRHRKGTPRRFQRPLSAEATN